MLCLLSNPLSSQPADPFPDSLLRVCCASLAMRRMLGNLLKVFLVMSAAGDWSLIVEGGFD